MSMNKDISIDSKIYVWEILFMQKFSWVLNL